MKIKSSYQGEEKQRKFGWIDEELDSDALDLEEWAFWQGYNDEE